MHRHSPHHRHRHHRHSKSATPLSVLKLQERLEFESQRVDPFQNVLPPGTNIQSPDVGNNVYMNNKDLRSLTIFGAVFKNKQFNNTHLEGTKFVECNFVDTNFDGAIMDNLTEFIKCVFRNCKTDRINFININETDKQKFERVFQNQKQQMMMGGKEDCKKYQDPGELLECLKRNQLETGEPFKYDFCEPLEMPKPPKLSKQKNIDNYSKIEKYNLEINNYENNKKNYENEYQNCLEYLEDTTSMHKLKENQYGDKENPSHVYEEVDREENVYGFPKIIEKNPDNIPHYGDF